MRLDDFTTVTRARTLDEPTRDPQLVNAVAQRLLHEYAPARPVRLLGVRVAGLGGVGARERRAGETGAPAEDQLALPV